MSVNLNNLAITATGNAMSRLAGMLYDTLQSKLANGGRDVHCKFYYSGGNGGGSILQVVTKSIVGGVVTDLVNVANQEINLLFNKKKTSTEQYNARLEELFSIQEEEKRRFGMMPVEGGHAVMALDDWGCISTDALMLGFEQDKTIHYMQEYVRSDMPSWSSGRVMDTNQFDTKTLVWYDTTALISISSDKNTVITPVQGRDYSRKELVSNGDVKISVNGHITSKLPDVYPEKEVKKFLQVMKYKGIVHVNNQILSQLGIENIFILDYSLPSREGAKSVQDYSFNAIGLQPRKELEADVADTVIVYVPNEVDTVEDTDPTWASMLQSQLDGLKGLLPDLASQGVALGSGILEQTINESL